MVSVTKFAGTITQTTGGKYRDFSNLNNLKNKNSGAYATSNGLIRSKKSSPNRPSTISLSNFGFNLPVGAEVTKIIVTFAHRKNKSNGAVCNIGGPMVTLLGTGDNKFGYKKPAPTTSFATIIYNCTTSKITRAMVNSSSFGVKIDYPTNSNTNEGTLSIGYVTITVEYKTSSYSVSVNKVSGGYNNEDYVVQCNISNKNFTSYNPSLTLTTPAGFNLVSAEGTGTIATVNARTFTWNPQLNSKLGTSSINLKFSTDVTFPTGVDTFTGSFMLVESLNGTTGSHTATIQKKLRTEEEEVAEDETQVVENYETLNHNEAYLLVVVDEEFIFNAEFTQEENDLYNSLDTGESIVLTTQQLVNGSWVWRDHIYPQIDYDESVPIDEPDKWSINQTLSLSSLGTYKFYLRYENEHNHELDHDLRQFIIYVRPALEDLENPYLSTIKLTEEEANRLGHGHVYTVQTFMNENTEEDYVRDWYKNFRLAVFNNAISENVTVTETEVDGEIVETITDSTDYEELDITDLFENAEYWSEPLSEVNTFENLECSFVYNENYPIYILICGDWGCADDYSSDGWSCATIQFTEPCIIESQVYKEREENGIYPVSINDLVPVEVDGEIEINSAELYIPPFNHSTSVILYDLPLEENYGTNETVSVRGIEIVGTVEQSDELTLNAKLKNSNGGVGQRSVLINNQDFDNETEFHLGGLGDLWGFSTLEIKNLEDWELELLIDNNIEDTGANINFGNVRLILYLETIQEQKIHIKVEDEDISFYGAFTEDVNIPEGLETDTSFLNIDGTDTNDAYRQNVREKEISIVLSLGHDCDIQTSTDMLRHLTKLFVNERDEYNRPIPKKIEFSHYPDVYFEYILKDAFDSESEINLYTVKVKLTIPSGTAFSKEQYATGVTGFVQGLVAVNPILTFRPQSSSIEIKENISGQRFNMSYNGDWQDKIVEINCHEMTVYLKTDEDDLHPIDISVACDFNVDWFSLHGEYQFEGTGCTIRTVYYNERW